MPMPHHVSPARAQVDKELKQLRWALFSTLLLGVIVLILAVIGEASLTGARNMFPFIHQSYNAWKMTYHAGVMLLVVLWAFGLHHRLQDIENCKQNQSIVIRQDRRRPKKVTRVIAVEPVQPVCEKPLRVRSVRDTTSWTKKPGRSTKFDF